VYRRRYESRRSSKPKCHFKKYGEKRFLIWRMEFLHPAMWHDHDIDFAMTAPCHVASGSGNMTVNSPSGSTLQCDTWLWNDMPLNSPKRPSYWNATSGFDFDHITVVDMLFCTSLRNFIQIGPPSAEKNDVMSIFKMADLSHLGFYSPIMGSLKSPCTISYMSSIDTIALNCLVFEKIVFFSFWRQTNRRTDGQHRCTKPLSLSRAAA